jgi:antitoxin (DNA-binding transcriptional repressor) of toxin-antitoxin stability system
MAMMKEANISQVKNNLSRYLAWVKQGGVVRILDRDRPIAQIVPIDRPRDRGAPVGVEALLEMERKGLIRRGSGTVDRDILERNPPGRSSGVLAALLEEREGR